MKWLVYLLLLANISFFAWHFQATDRDGRRGAGQPDNMPAGVVRLVTLKEASEAAPAVGPQCPSLGPFASRDRAEQIQKQLQQDGISLQLRISNEARRRGYWVYLAPAASHAEARKTAQTLKKKHRIKDIFVVGTGEKKNGISLGVFSRFELAYRRQDEIRKLGFDAQLKEVKLPAREYWLDWPATATSGLSAAQKAAIRKLAPSATIVKTACPS